jgi:hypothetical protein
VAERVVSHDEWYSHNIESCVCHDHKTPGLSVVKIKKKSNSSVKMKPEALVIYLKWMFISWTHLQAEPDIGALLIFFSHIVRFY